MTTSQAEQDKIREYIQEEPDYFTIILNVFLRNPFFRLTDTEAEYFAANLMPLPLRGLVMARHAAMQASAPRYAVFCMPKSGSSFVQSALQHALETPFVSVTSVATPGLSSYYGMNAREQEVDELALVKAILTSPQGFVAQHHTRYSMYLALQMRAFGVTPIVTIRNILDCIVSFDDMMREWRKARTDKPWLADPQFALPLNYLELAPATRYELLANSLGVWLVAFYLSWKRGVSQGMIAPIVVRYEEDILDRDRFVALMSGRLGLSEVATDRLRSYALDPDPEKSRLNVGVKGRGREKIPESVQAFLVDHLRLFAEEISEDEVRYLIR